MSGNRLSPVDELMEVVALIVEGNKEGRLPTNAEIGRLEIALARCRNLGKRRISVEDESWEPGWVIDLDTGKQIPDVIWVDEATGEYCHYTSDPQTGVHTGKVYGRGHMKFFPQREGLPNI